MKTISKNGIILLFILSIEVSCHSQNDPAGFTADNFAEKIMTYVPVQKKDISDEAFGKGKFQLESTLSNIGRDPEKLIAGDYWNIGNALSHLGEDRPVIELAFELAAANDRATLCQYAEKISGSAFEQAIPETFARFRESCKSLPPEKPLDLDAYIAEQKLDAGLVRLMADIKERDGRHRSDEPIDWEKQHALDRRNQQQIDSLYRQHGAYVGRSLVGEKFEFVMFQVIQHSDPERMDAYLPVVAQAVEENEVSDTALKYLLDRIYALREGYQIFGSQQGVPGGTPEQIRSVKEKYQLR